jgi:hypothetical protein
MQNQKNSLYRLDVSRWSVERIVFLIAGILVVALTLLGLLVHPGFHYAALFVGGMLAFFALTGYCPMAMLVGRCLMPRQTDR